MSKFYSLCSAPAFNRRGNLHSGKDPNRFLGREKLKKQSFSHLYLFLLVTALCFNTFQASAQWDHVKGFFKASFNASTGTIHIEAFAHNGNYSKDGFGRGESLTTEEANLYYSTDDVNWTRFWHFGYERNTTNLKSSAPESGFSGSRSNSVPNGSDRIEYITVLLNERLKTARYIKLEANIGHENNGGSWNSTSISITNPPVFSLINTPTFEFVKVQGLARARITYTKNSLENIDNQSTIALFNSNGAQLSGNMAPSTRGSSDAEPANSEILYYYKQSAYNGRVTNTSPSVAVPAFTFPKTASARYDSANHKVIFRWTIDPVTSSNLITTGYKIQVANNPAFTDSRDIKYDYKQSNAADSIAIESNLSPRMYFRVAREYSATGWDNWDLSKTADVAVVFNPIIDNSVSLELKDDNSALIKWHPGPTSWIPGATFIITRINNTSKTQTEIRLSQADYEKGQYIDQQISVCNEYTYSLQVLPPSTSDFRAFAPAQTRNKILPLEIGKILNLAVSKGYYPDRTELTWSSEGAFDNFIIKRAVYGTTNFIQLSSVTGSSNSDFQTDDTKGTPGVYYTYQVIGVVRCNNQPVYSKDTLHAVGFRSPTGNIYGRVTYENGQAVDSVAVRLQSNDVAQLGQSIYLNGNNESYLKLESLNVPFSDTSFTIEAWIKPDDAAPVNQVIFSRRNQYEIGFDRNGQLYFSYKGISVTGIYSNPGKTFKHITGIYNGDSLTLMLDDEVIGSAASTTQPTSEPEKIVYIGRRADGNNFKGFIDEMRLWNIALSGSAIKQDYTRMMAGNEPGLVAYWRFDETITDAFYDLSRGRDEYNRNDGVMNKNYVTRSRTIPTSSQLSLKSYTDISGNYMITGIPFSGNGTTYTIVPLLGTHQFDPVSVNRLVSSTSLEFTVDFKDKSSFPVSGFVYYNESTVPVPNVQFQIDGKYAQQSNGTIIETGTDGSFTISVPVGTHEVKAIKTNHVFVNDGKITDRFGNNLNYQGSLSERVLLDSTTIKFIGRVAGGPNEEKYILGHSLSANNLGKQLSMNLALPSDINYKLYSGPGGETEKTVINNHLLPSNKSDKSKVSKSRVIYQQKKIIVYPDSLTGEFELNLIPVKFLVESVTATGWDNIIVNNPVSLDFTNKFSRDLSVNVYKDSSQNNEGRWIVRNYVDSVYYNASYKFIQRVAPGVSIQQVSNGLALPYFGNKQVEISSLTGAGEKITVIDSSKTGKAMYKYGRPIFNQNQRYEFLIKAFEQYPFYESVQNDGTKVIKQENGKNVVQDVPTRDGLVSILNYLRNGSTQADTISLDQQGQASYFFTAGDPDLAAAGIKNFSASVRFGQALNVNWSWHGDPQMQPYVMGGKLTGTDFVTAGPDKLLMVLRDPPGQKSFSYLENGSVISSSSTYTGSIDQVGDEELTKVLAVELITFTGVGVGTINTATASTGISFGINHEEHFTGSNSKEETTTLTTRFQTSDDPLFVGAPADVFVGYSTNITYGQSNNITIIKRSERSATDILLFEADGSSEYIVIQRGGINIGEVFGTMFAYPQQHIEHILIPNLVNIRNSALYPPTTSAADAQQTANTSRKPVYVSKLPADHPNFGKSNNDITAFGESAKNSIIGDGSSYSIYFPGTSSYRTDTIMILNQYISNWISRMADNEKAKIESRLYQNYSYHAGATVSHVKQASIKTTKENSFSFVVSGSISNSTDVKIKSNGFEFKFKESLGTTQGGTFSNSSDAQTTLGFNLSTGGTDDYFSIDVNKAADSSFVFRTKGGVSACPYHGINKTKYYEEGTVLDQPTQRAEVPSISVEQAVVNNIPQTRLASYVLKLRNESEARLPQTFILRYVDNDSVKGATIAVDGASIGSGRAVVVQYGETLTKILTLAKGPKDMDFNDIMILLTSSCQYDPTGYQEKIADTVLISAHFIPSCSDIAIKSPGDKWILNTGSPVNTNQRRYLPIIIDRFDVNNTLFDHIQIQYKPASSSRWITTMKFYADSVKFKAAEGEKQFITNAQAIHYDLEVDDAAFSDQDYQIQAVSICNLGPGNLITTESNVISGIKDTYHPRLFGSPQPANGVLGISDEIRLNFNEPIAGGSLTPADFQVTGIRNGVKGNHSVSVSLDGQKDFLATEFTKNVTGKNLTAEMWILPSRQATETVFSQGNVNESMELQLTADNHLQVTVGKKVAKSDKPFIYRAGEWAHVAVVYNAVSKTVSAFYNFTELMHSVPVDVYTGVGVLEFGRSISKQGNFFNGKMHEGRVWADTLNSIQLQVNSLKQLSGAENKLLAYYPMNEGKGNISFDKAHGSHAKITGQWSTPAGKAIMLSGNSHVKLNTSFAPVTSAMDYTIEMWFKAEPSQTDATLASNGKGDGSDGGGSLNAFCLGFEGGLLTFQNNGFKVQADGNYLDNKWHHVSLAVNRNAGNAQVFVDGLLQKYFDAKNIGGITSASTYLGVRAFNHPDSINITTFDRRFRGNIDEFRIWNTYLNQTLINNNSNTRLLGNELGLLAYYPFDKYFDFQNNKEMGYTLGDMKIQTDLNAKVPDAIAVNATESNEMAPVKDSGPVDNLKFDFVVNNDALIIKMQEPKEAIDKTIITFKVEDARDLNGNKILSPITWTAYIDQNQLKWSDKELNLTKDIYAPLQFESHLVNSGGSIQHYRLDNIPAWLKAEPANGTVAPKSQQKVVFTVNEGLNVGAYDELVFMRNDNNEAEAIRVNLKVKAKEPVWTVNPAEFRYNMNVYGKVRINNIFSINKEDKLAAFINGRCVGITTNTYNAQNDLWYAFLTVYSDSLNYSSVEFRIWEANTGKTYQAVSASPVAFSNNSIAGSATNPIIFDAREMLIQDITLNQNWNWVSFNLFNSTFNSIGATLANGKWASGDIVKNELLGFNQYSISSGWAGYLTGFNNTSLFMLKAANAQTLSIRGNAVDVKTTGIPLRGNRWNYISYLPQVNMTVKDALAGYTASEDDVIKSQTGFAMYSAQNGWIGSLTYLEPGKGYMMYRKATADTTFYYPSLTGRLTNQGSRLNIADPNSLQNPVEGNVKFANNMTVVAAISKNFELKPDDNVVAFVGGEIRGKAKPVLNEVLNEYGYFLNISGEQEQQVYFMIERNGTTIARSDVFLNFLPNSSYGTLQIPVVLNFEEDVSRFALYPNPFKARLNISLNLKHVQGAENSAVEMSVFDVNGKLMLKRPKEQMINGNYSTTWNGRSSSGSECTSGVYFIHLFYNGITHVYKVIKQ